MAYDLKIFDNKAGSIKFVLPDSGIDGTGKLVQRVVISLFSDNGELIKFTKGSANATALTETLLVNETNRVKELLFNNTPAHYPDSEKLDALSLKSLNSSGSSASIEVSVTSVDMSTDNITINL